MHNESFGQQLRRLRRAHDLTQEALAEQAGCAVDTLRAIESGRRRPSRELATILAERLHVPAAEHQAFLDLARATPAEPPPLSPAPGGTPAPQSAPAPALIGRAEELELLAQRLADPACRLLSLTGPGGIGKTSLATTLAASIVAHFPDGVVSIALAGVQHPAEGVQVVAQALGVRSEGGPSTTTQVAVALAARRQLLVLDNLEQLLAGPELVELIAGVLAGAPGVRLLVTTRERLRLRDEWVYELGGLAITSEAAASDAVLLFVERARRVQRDFALSPANSEAVSRVCRLVGGTPLAIELAASWLPTLSPAEIAAELERSLDLLDSDARDLPARHRSVRTVFEGSWRLLSPDQQRLLARLALFRGGFTREAAEFVAGARLPQLAALVQKSLVRREGERYTLHELIRQYCAEQLARSGDAVNSERRFVDYYRALAASVATAFSAEGQAALLNQLAVEADNLRVALKQALARGEGVAGASLCASLYLYWSIRGLVREGLAWVEQFLALPGLVPQDRGRLMSIAVPLLQRSGSWQQALAIVDKALALVGDDNGARSIAHFGAGNAALDQGAFDLARHHLEASLALERRQPRLSVGAATIAIIGLTYFCEGMLDEAQTYFAEALAIAQRERVEFVVAYATYCLGVLDLLSGDTTRVAQLREVLALCHRYNYKLLIATCLEALASQSGLLGDHERAGRLQGAAEQLRTTHNLIVTPGLQPMHKRLAALARGPLDDKAWEATLATGRQLTQAEAVALALGEHG